MVQYYISCKRELWFYANRINMNYNNEDITIGNLIHEKSYSRENKEIHFENMAFDFVKKKEGITIFEVKKSSKLTEPAKYQLLYYLYNMKKSGIDARGILVYPEERKREKIQLTSDLEEEMEDIIESIEEIVSFNKPPIAEKKHYCKKCSFYELCMV
ncbi:CRISPR-associated protein Cas4 [Methanobrevibacter sp.]|uniref:CRISPR-associated protein Cas4 n=1 Tax=Methanobrevibacter sp. TaxID=66852 RepID=UPI002636994E|nr:CRISPR-associated protein Cas4 [uncultured Methanobrevibacter sp.]